MQNFLGKMQQPKTNFMIKFITNLFGPGSIELSTIAKILGKDVQLIGFFANGEISNSRLYGYTGVLSLIN